MKGGKTTGKGEDKGKYLYAEPKFMIPPDPLKLPEPFQTSPNKRSKAGETSKTN
jgi:hypothetical protein